MDIFTIIIFVVVYLFLGCCLSSVLDNDGWTFLICTLLWPLFLVALLIGLLLGAFD